MKYSLVNRFRGCFLGLAMGEGLGGQVNPSPHWCNPGKATVCSQLQWTAVTILQGERLAQAGQWIVEENFLPESLRENPTGCLSAGELAIATLPITLFYHDNLTQQRHHLAATVTAWGGDLSTSDAVIVFGYAIAQAIKEQLNPAYLIAQILTYLHVSLPESAVRSADLISTLETLKSLVAQGSELQSAIAAFQLEAETQSMTVEIAIALYCFLQTPDTIALALIRAVRMRVKPEIVGALVGALAGAYNSSTGIPAEWQCALQAPFTTPETPQRIHSLSTHLVSAWSGIYDPFIVQETEIPIVTVPWIVRSQRIVS
ncbi:ADP-ribosylglycohydrolase family protein [Leptolyngbyaceae cyanobacterium UHCC 1019]